MNTKNPEYKPIPAELRKRAMKRLRGDKEVLFAEEELNMLRTPPGGSMGGPEFELYILWGMKITSAFQQENGMYIAGSYEGNIAPSSEDKGYAFP